MGLSYVTTSSTSWDVAYRHDPLYKQEYPSNREITMSKIIDEVIDERAKDRIKKILERYDEFLVDTEWDDGDIISMEVEFHNRDTVYVYAAVRAKRRWYLTDGRKLSSDDLIKWLVSIEVDGGVVHRAPSLLEAVV